MVTQGANVRKGVLVLTSLFLTLQFAAIVATGIFYLYASSESHRAILEKFVFTRLYERERWRELRRNHALEVRTLFN